MEEHTTVLIIEDNPHTVNRVRHYLEDVPDVDFMLHVCTTLADGIAYLRQNRVNVVLLDPTLPDSDGLEAIQSTRAHVTVDTPIVVMTGIPDPGLCLKAAAHGADDCLIADQVDGHQIVQSIQYAIERKRATDELARANRAYRLLSEINRAANRASSESELLSRLCEIIVDTGGYRMAWVEEPGTHGGSDPVRPGAWAGDGRGFVGQADAPWPDAWHGIHLIDEAIRERRAAAARQLDAAEDAEPWRQAAVAAGFGSILALPLVLGEDVIGGLGICAGPTDAFDADEIALITEVLDDVAFRVAAYRARASQEQTERALRESEQRYRTLFDNVPAGIYRSTPGGRLLKANQALVDMLGFPDRETLLNIDVRTLYVDPSIRDVYIQEVKKHAIVQEQFQLRRYDGQIIWVEDNRRVVWDDQGEILRFEGELRDVTEQRLSEMAESDQRQFAEALSGIATALNSTLDMDEVLDRILNAVEQVAPHDAANIFVLDRGIARLVRSHGPRSEVLLAHPDRFQFDIAETANLRWIAEHREPLIIGDVEEYPGWDRARANDWVRSTVGLPIEFNGELIGFITIDSTEPDAFLATHASRLQAFAHQAAVALQNARYFQNIKSHRDDLEKVALKSTIELQQTLERMQTILSNAPDPILLLGLEGQIEVSNPAFRRLFGYNAPEVTGLSLLALAAPDQRPLLHSALSQVNREHQTARLSLVAQTKAGDPLDVELGLAPVLEGDRLLSVVASLRDISQIKEVERIKDSFISMAAHELRTPLTSIRGFSEILLHRTLEPERAGQYLSFIHEQSEQLALIIEDLLDLSRLKSGQGIDLKPEMVEIAELVQEVVGPLAEIPPQHPILQTGLEDLLPIRADRVRLAQVIQNLVSNAIKFSPERTPIRISGEQTETDVLIAVRDEGISMTREQQALAFDPFYRANMTNTAPEGTGLGLSICRMIVEEHGGDIRVESAPGAGSTFTVRLPR